MLSRMKTYALSLAAAVLAGCASYPGMEELGRAIQQAGDAVPAYGGSGSGAGSGSVASGGTGYLPCLVTPGTRPGGPTDCK